MIRSHTCFIAECDTPDCEPFDDHDYTPHFDSEEEAIARLVEEWGWTYKDWGRGLKRKELLCPADSARRQCEQTGHQWQRWGSDPDVGVTEEGCGRCDTTRLVAIPA
ncbi:hypothetical protein NGM33_28455 [Nocardiopsis dassonvillei]|uniref:hypothetical protein n=1 Tax=Nocardiopsis dassonvillei TaxID=2014 RepID=UPI0020A30DC5|nr:hypothetical protein [Nocardiopsis dassonvillei]MCP3017268.1 hypothetical protein [Nocardiopsis dassonvillei]